MEEVSMKMVTSFLQARDKSILAWNRAELKNVKVNLEQIIDENGEVTIQSPSTIQEDKCIRVYLRLKGGESYKQLYEIDENNLICKVPDGSYSTRNLKYGDAMTRSYTFTNIFRPSITQLEIFNNVVKARLLGFLNGKNSTLFTYGASGSGKTYTIVGTPEEPGLIPRALEYIFRTLPDLEDKPRVKPLSNGSTQELDANLIRIEEQNKTTILNATVIDKRVHIKTYRQMQERLSSEPVAEIESAQNVSVSIWVSFAEIYNENIHDLLVSTQRGKPRTKLPLGNTNDLVYIKNLTTVHVTNGLEAYQILQFGIHNLRYAPTAINSHSSRSHSIFTIHLVQTSTVSDRIFMSSFNFCDLAGSERMKKTMNIGDRQKESNNINTSLLVLGRCIENIKCMQQLKDKRLIPFRESKLTQLFKRALLGHENIEMIVNINPSRDMFDETHHALNFSAIAKEIMVEEKPKRATKRKNRFSQLMERDRPHSQSDSDGDTELERLRQTVTDLYDEIEQKRLEHEREIEDEKAYVAKLHREYYEKKLLRLQMDHEEELEVLREHHRQELETLRAADDSVINISSSSNECCSPRKNDSAEQMASLKSEVFSLNEQNMLLEAELRSTKEKLKKSQQDFGDYLRVREECASWRNRFKDSEELLREAQATYEELQEENSALKMELKKLNVSYILLEEEREKVEQFTSILQNSLQNRDESDEEGNTITESECTFSQSRIRDEDKKFY